MTQSTANHAPVFSCHQGKLQGILPDFGLQAPFGLDNPLSKRSIFQNSLSTNAVKKFQLSGKISR